CCGGSAVTETNAATSVAANTQNAATRRIRSILSCRVVGGPVRCGRGGWGARRRERLCAVGGGGGPGQVRPRGRLRDCQTSRQTFRYGRGALLWRAPLRMSDPT